MAVKVPSKVTLQSPSMMIWLSVGLAALYWVLEALMDAFVFNEGGFVERLITPDRNELWMRVIAYQPACHVLRRHQRRNQVVQAGTGGPL